MRRSGQSFCAHRPRVVGGVCVFFFFGCVRVGVGVGAVGCERVCGLGDCSSAIRVCVCVCVCVYVGGV